MNGAAATEMLGYDLSVVLFLLGLLLGARRVNRRSMNTHTSCLQLGTFAKKIGILTSEQGHSRCQECVKVRTDVALCSPRRVTRASDRARAVFKTCTRCNAQDLTESVIANVLVSDQAVPTNVVPTVVEQPFFSVPLDSAYDTFTDNLLS